MHLLVHLLMKLFVLIVQCSVSYLFEMTIVQKELKKLTNEVIASLTGYPFILEGLSVAEI